MRYLSLIFIICIMWWTWSVTHTEPAISQAEHVSIQNQLKQVIHDYIAQKLPSATNIRFDQFWTEALNSNSIRASFSYTFDDQDANHQTTQVGIKGYAILNRKPASQSAATEAQDEDDWSLDELTVTNNHYYFKDGTLISK